MWFVLKMYKNTWLERSDVLILFVILIMSSVVTSATEAAKGDVSTDNKIFNLSFFDENIIYVDDDNTEGPWNGTMEYPYQFIQDGVDNAESDNTVFVFNGIYYEHVIINKKINLTGEQKEITIIDGSNDDEVLSVTENYVSINGFTIQNSGSPFQDAGIYIRSHFNTISNTILCSNTVGIYLRGSHSNVIKENTFTDCDYGIYLEASDSNSIKDNIFLNNTQGVTLEKSSSNDIHGNIISDNVDGITLTSFCDLNTIVGNHISDNMRYGIFMRRLFEKQNDVYHNNFINNFINAYIETSIWTNWEYNYWDNWFGLHNPQYDFLPKVIIGCLIPTILWVNFDFHPAKEPFEM